MTNGPHAHCTTPPGDPALIRGPVELIHASLAAQVGVDKSTLLESQLQGYHSVEKEDRLEFLNFIFYWNSWQQGATDPSPRDMRGFQSVSTAHLPGDGATSLSASTGLAVQPSRRVIDTGVGG